MPSSLTLCWRFCSSNTVMVSPSLTPTTLPMMVCGCHVGSKSEIKVGVGDDRAINTAELVGGGSIALQPTSNRPKTHAAHFFGFPDLSDKSVNVPPYSNLHAFGVSELLRRVLRVWPDGNVSAPTRSQVTTSKCRP